MEDELEDLWKDTRTVQFKEWKCDIQLNTYMNNDRICIDLVGSPGALDEGEPILTATVNVPECFLLEDEVLIKDYSENAGVLAKLVEAGVVVDMHRTFSTGYVEASVARYVVQGSAEDIMFQKLKDE